MQQEAKRSAAIHNLAARPEFSEILTRIRKLAPEISARALSTEKARRVPVETMNALRDADVIGFELGRACGSTGWCGTLAVCFGWMTAFFPLEAQQEVWDDTNNLLAVSYTP